MQNPYLYLYRRRLRYLGTVSALVLPSTINESTFSCWCTINITTPNYLLHSMSQAFALSSCSLHVWVLAPWGTPPVVIWSAIIRSSILTSVNANESLHLLWTWAYFYSSKSVVCRKLNNLPKNKQGLCFVNSLPWDLPGLHPQLYRDGQLEPRICFWGICKRLHFIYS